MITPLVRRASRMMTFTLERLLLRGTFAQLLVIAALLGLVSLAGGAALWGIDRTVDPPGAVWWAFLRLSDPGYLGDDEGAWRRVVATMLTVAGYVLFMGSLVAIMTQWLNRQMRELERGLTPIALRGHLVVVGWTSRTAVITREMFTSVARVRRFLATYDARVLRLVLLLEDLDAGVRHQLRQQVGDAWRERSVVMRSGSALYLDDLVRADVAHASAILVPSEDLGPSEGAADARTVKTLLSLQHHLMGNTDDEMPLVVTELFDAQKLSVARRAYRGPLELVCSDRLVGRLLALAVLHPGLSLTFEELFAFGHGNEIYVVDAPELEGEAVTSIRRRLPEAILLGFVEPQGRSFAPRLCPAPTDVMGPGQRLVVVATDSDHARPAASAPHEVDRSPSSPPATREPARVDRVLVIGWSDRVPDLVHELQAHRRGPLEVHVLSVIPTDEREVALVDEVATALTLHHVEGDITKRSVIAASLEAPFDRIVLMASDWHDSGAQSDARTVLTFLLVRDELERMGRDTRVVVELMDGTNRALVEDVRAEVIVSPQVIGRVLAQVTLRRELRTVYDDLVDADGPALRLRSATSYGLAGSTTFATLAHRVAATGDVLIGLVPGAPGARPHLNPDKASSWDLDENPTLVVVGP